MSTREQLGRLDAVLRVGLRLARSAPSGRILMARVLESIDPAWIPSPWGDELIAEFEAAHLASQEPLPFATVQRLLRDAWDAPISDELDDLESEPEAVTPSAQVHRGVLEGSPVAVKVLRPGLAGSVRQDLALVEGIIGPLASAFPAIDAVAIVREFRERVLDELDLEHEATVQRHFHRRLRRHPFLYAPAPVTRLASENVLVSEWVDGVTLWDAPDPDQAAARLIVFALGAGRSGMVHADPLPDDVLVREDGTLVILDFGATRPITSERMDLVCGMVQAFVDEDLDGLGAALEQLGWLPAQMAREADSLVREVLGELAGPDAARLDSPAVIDCRERLFDRPDELVRMLQSGSLAPEDLWPLRGVTQAFATVARVGASARWRELTLAALREGWEASAD